MADPRGVKAVGSRARRNQNYESKHEKTIYLSIDRGSVCLVHGAADSHSDRQ